MSATRYEILLPLKYNDGLEVEAEKFLLTTHELVERFGAVTVDPQPMQGVWTFELAERFQRENPFSYEVSVKVMVDSESDSAAVRAQMSGNSAHASGTRP